MARSRPPTRRSSSTRRTLATRFPSECASDSRGHPPRQSPCKSSPLRPRRPPRFFLFSGSESTAEDAEDAEGKRECDRATHYHPNYHRFWVIATRNDMRLELSLQRTPQYAG